MPPPGKCLKAGLILAKQRWKPLYESLAKKPACQRTPSWLAETEDWVTYDLPHELVPRIWKGRFKGQKQKWVLMRFTGSDDQINIETEHPEFSEWCWLPASDLVANIVPFKREVYEQVLVEFESRL